jgi:short-subunit dehydrogenase
MRINYEGTVNLVTATLPGLLERKQGELVCFGSVAGQALTPRLGAYCASKAAVNAYMEILAHELAGSGVTIHCICPPMVDTPLIQQSMTTDGPKSLQQAIDEKMLAKPDDIIDAVEKALAKKASVSYPLVTAKILSLFRRVAPGLLWTVIERAETAMAAKKA